MKNNIRFCLLLYMIMNMTSLHSLSFSIAIPQELVHKNATLLLLISDHKGQKSCKKYRLGHTKATTVREEELELATEFEQDHNDAVEIVVNDLTSFDLVHEQSVVVHFQLDSQCQVLRVMVLKDCLLDHNPFDIVSIPLCEEMEFEQLYEEMQDVDSIDKLSQNLQHADFSNLSEQQVSWFEKYMFYAKVFVYEVKKAINISDWWN